MNPLLTGASTYLLAAGLTFVIGAHGSGQHRPNPVTVEQNISRALAILSTRKRTQRATPYIRAAEKDMDVLAKRQSTDLVDALQNARYGLVNAQLFFKAKTQRRKLTSEEANVLEELATFTYDCEIVGRDGVGRGAVIDVCIDNVLAYVKENRDLARRLLKQSSR